jgi:predicted esterase
MAESWVKVAAAPDETDALLMEGVLKDAGIPSLIQRARGFDVPDFLSAGPRDVLVPNSLVEEARQVLQDTTGLGSYVP